MEEFCITSFAFKLYIQYIYIYNTYDNMIYNIYIYIINKIYYVIYITYM